MILLPQASPGIKSITLNILYKREATLFTYPLHLTAEVLLLSKIFKNYTNNGTIQWIYLNNKCVFSASFTLSIKTLNDSKSIGCTLALFTLYTLCTLILFSLIFSNFKS